MQFNFLARISINFNVNFDFLFQVFFKKIIFEGKLGQVSLFLTLLGVTNLLFMWIFFLPLYYGGVEKVIFSSIPWSFLCGSSALFLGE